VLSPYQSFWKPGVGRVRAVVKESREIFVFLHLAKTGGSSLCDAMMRTHLWSFVQFPEPHRGIASPCSCGAPSCPPGHVFDVMIPPTFEREAPGRGLFVNTSHVTYDLARWLAKSISMRGHRARMVTTVRPARRRAISYFRDYWEQVSKADLPLEQVHPDISTKADAARLQSDLNFYKEDSRYYLNADGSINGRAWFEAQVLNAAGFPFLLRDVFGHPSSLEQAIAKDSLLIIPTAEIDMNLERVGLDLPRRMRVSSPPSVQLTDAIERSTEVLDRIVEAEAEYDAVLRHHLGVDRFPES
jgi:hypothetical protein